MDEHSIKTYTDLQNYYRTYQKYIWQQVIKSTKRIIYRVDENSVLGIQSDDIIQWTGSYKNIQKLVAYANPVIISSGDVLNLNVGYGKPGNSIITWQTIQNNLNFTIPNFKGQVLGAEAQFWGELVTDETIMQKVWIRGSVLAERTWNNLANKGQINS